MRSVQSTTTNIHPKATNHVFPFNPSPAPSFLPLTRLRSRPCDRVRFPYFLPSDIPLGKFDHHSHPTPSIDQNQARNAGSSSDPPPPPPAYPGPSSHSAAPQDNYEANAARRRKLDRRDDCRKLTKFLVLFVLLILMAASVIWYLSLEPRRDCEEDGKVNGERMSGKIYVGDASGGSKCR